MCPCFVLALTGRHDAVEWHLAHDQENDQSHTCPYYPLVEGDLRFWDLYFGDEGRERFHEVEEADCVPWSVSKSLVRAGGRGRILGSRALQPSVKT
jgi:hypothetical protein